MSREYPIVTVLEPLIVGEAGTPVGMCSQCGALVGDTAVHDQFHDDPAGDVTTIRDAGGTILSTLECRCQDDPPDGIGPYWFCPVHQRAAYQGDILSDGGVLHSRSTGGARVVGTAYIPFPGRTHQPGDQP